MEAASLSIKSFAVSGSLDEPVAEFDVVNTWKTRAEKIMVGVGRQTMAADDLGGFLQRPLPAFPPAENGFSLESTEPRHFRFPLIPHEVHEKLPPELKFQNRKDAVLSQAMIVYVSGSYVDVFGKEHHVADCLSSVGAEFHPCFASNRHY